MLIITRLLLLKKWFQNLGGGEYWLGAGCDRRSNFQHMSCQNVRTMSRSVQLGW